LRQGKPDIQIGLLGLGVVGGGVYRILQEKSETYARRVGRSLGIKKVLVRHPEKTREATVDPGRLTTDPEAVLNDPEIAIIIEVMGGESPAYDYLRAALKAGKSVVTANKEVMAKYGTELFALAHERGVDILFEASVGGGIPIIAPLKRDLLANDITSIRAIINGTTNYILTRMSQDGWDFGDALAKAQALGYAEADPTNDVEGIDAGYKLAILASLAFHSRVRPADVYHEGITRLTARDFRYARELGYTIKLLALAERDNGSVRARVHPALIAADESLAKVDNVFNAVEVEGDLLGRVLFQGQGAGSLPTTSAVVADVLDLAHDLAHGSPGRVLEQVDAALPVRPMADLETRYYLRITVSDRPGVLAQIAKVLGDHAISIASVIQKEADEAAQTAELVIMTHTSQEAAMQRALDELCRLSVVSEVGSFVRVE
jgi:homoserine dehydrogenase